MSDETVNSDVLDAPMPPKEGARATQKKVTTQNIGARIMQIADKLRPGIAKMFEGVRDENNQLVSPARVRGIALNVAQRLVREQLV